MCGQPSAREAKSRVRESVWRLLEERGVAVYPLPVHGRIPNFRGAEEAARRLSLLEVWSRARVLKVNPDSPQRPVRLRALEEGKKVLMPTPRLRNGFLLLDPGEIPPQRFPDASSISGAFRWGRRLSLDEIPRVDLIVIGSVAVDRAGSRVGKGGGYAELEYAILRETGRVGDETPVVTTVHDLQIWPHPLPREPHDLPVNLIVTPTRILEATRPLPRPRGVIWELLSEEEIREIQPLGELRRLRGPGAWRGGA